MERWVFRRDPSLPPSEITYISQGVDSLVLSVPVSVKEIARLGRAFPWIKPGHCPRCNSGLWWHGFVLAYFSCLGDPVYLRRLRCPNCGAVHRLKPQGYFRRFRSPVTEIQGSINRRDATNRWHPDLPRARQRQWWRRLGRMIRMIFGVSSPPSHSNGFTLLMERSFIPVSAGKKENRIN